VNHYVHPELLSQQVRVLVAGTGDLGIVSVTLLPYLHRSLLCSGHPGGLEVTVLDGDSVSHGCRRTQPFRDADVGEPKSVVIVERINALWGLEWLAGADDLVSADQLAGVHVLLGCAATARKRAALAECSAEGGLDYWLDLTTHPQGAQFVLGEPLNQRNYPSRARLRVVSELFPETIRHAFDVANESASDDPRDPRHGAEAFFANVAASHALMLLSRLLRKGSVSHQGGLVDPRGRVQRLRISPQQMDVPAETDRDIEIG
jgi:sulfur-carrier protein adenylyltransferase/sulfurtransferase